MNKTLITAIAVFALAAPLAAPAFAQPNMQHQQQQGQHNGDQTRGRDDNQPGNMHRDRNGRRTNWRDARSDARWDASQHNGYFQGTRWHYGPPPPNARNVTYGYHRWSTGQRLGYYNNRYQEVDWRSNHLRAPRRGYHWVRDDNGDFLLAAVATGLIASIILSNN